jgi:hypothetical protein
VVAIVVPVRQYYAHHKARLVKVVHVFILDTVLCLHILYQPEPVSDNLRVFAQGFLIAVLLNELDFELRATLDKDCSPVLADCLDGVQPAKNLTYL